MAAALILLITMNIAFTFNILSLIQPAQKIMTRINELVKA
jgi:hypothetical protein